MFVFRLCGNKTAIKKSCIFYSFRRSLLPYSLTHQTSYAVKARAKLQDAQHKPEFGYDCSRVVFSTTDADGNAVSLKRVSQIVGKEVPFIFADCCNEEQLEAVFKKVLLIRCLQYMLSISILLVFFWIRTQALNICKDRK